MGSLSKYAISKLADDADIVFRWQGDKAAGELDLVVVRRYGGGWQVREPVIPIATIRPQDDGTFVTKVYSPAKPSEVAIAWRIGTRKNAVAQANAKVRQLIDWCSVAFVPISVGRPKGARNSTQLDDDPVTDD